MMGGGEAHGVAIDLTSRTGVRILWSRMALVALGFGITRGLRARASVKRNKNQAFGFQLIAATVAFAVGGFVGVVAETSVSCTGLGRARCHGGPRTS